MDRLSHWNFAFSISSNDIGRKLKSGAREPYTDLDYETDITGVKAIADALIVSSSMNKLNILGNFIGDEGYEMLMKLAEEKGMLTFCGFEGGQTEADLSKKSLGPIDAKLIARELTTGYVSSSLNSLK